MMRTHFAGNLARAAHVQQLGTCSAHVAAAGKSKAPMASDRDERYHTVVYSHSVRGGGRVCDEDGVIREEWPAGGGGGEMNAGDLLSAKLGQHLGVRVGHR